MASFQKPEESMASLLAQEPGAPEPPKQLEKKHFGAAASSGVEAALQDGAVDEAGAPSAQKKHFGATATLTSGDTGLTAADAAAAFKPSVKQCEHPAGHGDITSQEIAPTDLSKAAGGGKRMFEGKAVDSVPLGDDADPASAPPPKKLKPADDSVEAVMATDDAAIVDHVPHKKIVADAANKVDRVGDAADPADAPPPPTRRHFEQKPDHVGGLLAHPQPEAPAKKALVDANNAALPPPVPSKAAGVSSTDMNKLPAAGVGVNAATAGAKAKALGGSAMAACLSMP